MPLKDKNANREYMREYMARRYERRHTWLIDMLGGACTECGSTTDLEFDHIDPTFKSFTICKKLAGVSWKRLMEEISKCQLLCKDCHKDKTYATCC